MKEELLLRTIPRRRVWKRHARESQRDSNGRKIPVTGRSERPDQAAMRPLQLRTILVPVDGSPAAEHALPYALALARRTGAKVALVGVYSTLQAANEPERVAKVCPVRPALVKGFWPEDVLCEIGDREADLIVMARRRRGWWSRFWSGSVSAGVARRSRSPVLLVPARMGRRI
jgi:nucleotide-binding universal stress UspA family protein